MAEVGVLNLQIHDNSSKAAEGLGRLASALERVKSSVNGIKSLGSVATQLEKITRAVTNASTSGTVENLNGIASALKRVKEASQGIDLSNLKFSPRSGKLDIEAAIDRIKRSTDEVNSGFVNVESHVDASRESASGFADQMERVNELVQNTAWSAGAMEEAFSRAFKVWSDMRSSHSLGGTAPILGLGAGTSETGWTQYNPFGETGENGWEVWKNGAIEAEYTISDSLENIGNRIEDTRGLFLEAGESIKEVGEDIEDALNESIKRVGNRDYGDGNYKQFNPASGFFESMEGVRSRNDLNQYRENLEGAKRTTEETIAELRQMFSESSDAIKALVAENHGLTVDEVFPPEVPEILQDTGMAMNEAAAESESFRDRLNELAESAKNAVSNGLNNMREGINNMLEPLSNLISRFGRIAMLRAMRYVIKEFTAAIKEGTQNMYQYSKAIGSEFASSMDSAASSLQQMKNSVGAALAPALQSIIPILNQIISVVITAINYLNQFLALLRGQSTWTRATPAAASAFKDIKSAAGGAAAAVKDLLADWDELNIIQSETGGGGGGGGGTAAEDYLNMFEEVSKFEKGLQSFVNHLKEEFGSIWGLVARIGAAILGWKISSAFSGLLGTLGGLISAGAIIDLTFKLTRVFDDTYLDTGEVGWLIGSVLTGMIGGVLTKKVLSSVLGTGWGSVGLSLALTFSALADIITLMGRTDVSALDEKSIRLSVVSALKTGTAAGYLAYTVGGYSLLGSIGGGTAVAIATFGVAIGLKAVVQTVDSGVTEEVLKAAALSSLAVGLGAGLFAKVAGATLLGAAAFGAAGAAFTIGVIAVGIGIAVILHNTNQIEWGKEELTPKQVEDFVNSKMFNIDVKTHAKVVAEQIIEPSEQERSEIESKLTNVLGTWKVIQLGIATDQDYATLQTDVNSLVETVSGYVETAKNEGKLTLQFIPTLAGETEGEQASWLTQYTQGWTAVDNFAKNTGKRIGELLVKAEAGTITAGESEVLESLMTQLANVTSAVSRSKIASEAFGNFMFNVGDLSQASFNDIVGKYKEYRDELRRILEAQANEQYATQGSLVAALFEIEGPEGERYKAAKAKYEQMGRDLVKAVDDAVKTESATGAAWLRDFLIEKYSDPLSRFGNDIDFIGFITDAVKEKMEGSSAGDIGAYINRFLMDKMKPMNADLHKYLSELDMSAWNVLPQAIKNQIKTGLEQAFGTDLTNEIIEMWELNNPVEEALKQAETPPIENTVPVETTVEETIVDESVSDNKPDTSDVVGDISEEVRTELGETQEVITQATMPAVNEADTSALLNGLASTATSVWGYVQSIINAIESLNNLGINTNVDITNSSGGGGSHGFATGGIIRTADMFMANENGNIEMMGKMGHSTVVANNQQIVEGISRGVSQSNSGMENAMNMMVALMRQFVNKEFTAKVVPSASMGRNNKQSQLAYDKVTG